MTEFTINMPEWPTPNPVATIRVMPATEFKTEALLLGYVPGASDETRGMTFCMECDKTRAKMSIVLINGDKLELSTLIHEIRHAYFWNVARPAGGIPCNVHNEEEEEAFHRRLDTLINRAVCTIESSLGITIPWRVV